MTIHKFMRLKDQVVSLELAKRLKELGTEQASAFYWCKDARAYAAQPWLIIHKDEAGVGNSKIASAFTVAELGELTKGVTESYYNPIFGKWACGMRETEDHCPIFFEETEANARAQALIYLLEKKG